jgi:hypothetical protein
VSIAYTNDHACDRDSTSAEPFLFFNPPLPAGMKSYGYGLGRKAIHAFQHILLFAILPFYYFLRFDVGAVWRISKYADTVKNPWLVETHVFNINTTHSVRVWCTNSLFTCYECIMLYCSAQ